MLAIRRDQMGAFESAAVRAFEDRMVEHFTQHLPRHCEAVGEPQVRAVVRLGVRRAEAHGLVSEGEVCFYIGLMLALGSFFDTDPQVPWAGERLDDELAPSPSARADQTHDEAVAFLERTAGRDGGLYLRALERFCEAPPDEVSPSRGTSLETAVCERLAGLWPQKAEALGPAQLLRLVRHGIGCAKGHGIVSERGVAVYVSLMFLLGSGFDRDPQYPWAAAALEDPAASAAASRIERLRSEAVACFARMLG